MGGRRNEQRAVPGGHRPRSPGLVYTAASLIAVLVLGLTAITTTQPPPPTIAEFAPQAVEQIEEAPSEQTSSLGAGSEADQQDGTTQDRAAEVAVASPDPIEVPRVRRCVGDPPRQIEDAQSPPCVPYWSGDNGGATYQGVSADEIRIGYVATDTTDLTSTYETLAAFFNSRFEFYGRTLRVIGYDSAGASSSEMVADAVYVDETIQAFAGLNYVYRLGSEVDYYNELARRKILSVAGRSGFIDQDHLTRHAPYQWSHLPGSDVAGRHLGEWACKTLHGQPAEHAGVAERGNERVFGILTHRTEAGAPDVGPLRRALSTCGVEQAPHVEVPIPEGDHQPSYRSAVLELQTAGVNSVICLCQARPFGNVSNHATSSGYFPEWIVSSWGESDTDLNRLRDREQAANTFGLRFWNKRLAFEDLPCQWAVQEVDPSFQWPRRAFGAESGYDVCHWMYPAFLLLASGIQMAGPDLTPHSFQEGLARARFPNPAAGEAPYWQGRVSFGGNDHVMNDDASVIWWDPNERSYEEEGRPLGTYCYLDRGRRFELGSHPTGRQQLFAGPCR